MTIGIYAIRNKTNGKLYVGSSVNIELRWMQHRSSLRRGNHHSPALQNAWNKYGENAFEFLVIEELLEADQLAQAEQKLIDHHKAYLPTNGYNIRAVVDRVTAVFSVEKRKQQAADKAERQRLREEKQRQRPENASPTNKKYKQVPLTIYPEAESMLEEAMKLTGSLQASVLREALTMGLKQILSQHQPPQDSQSLQEMQEKINQIWDKVIGEG